MSGGARVREGTCAVRNGSGQATRAWRGGSLDGRGGRHSATDREAVPGPELSTLHLEVNTKVPGRRREAIRSSAQIPSTHCPPLVLMENHLGGCTS